MPQILDSLQREWAKCSVSCGFPDQECKCAGRCRRCERGRDYRERQAGVQ